MKRFVEVADRGQSTLLTECPDKWVEESNSVRVIDCFVDTLDLANLRLTTRLKGTRALLAAIRA